MLHVVRTRVFDNVSRRKRIQAASNKHRHGGGAWNALNQSGESSSPGFRDDPATSSVNVDARGSLRDTVTRSRAGGCLSAASVAAAAVVESALADDELGGGWAARREAKLAPGQALAEPNEPRYLLATVADNLNQLAHARHGDDCNGNGPGPKSGLDHARRANRSRS
jgi:hypothetical protein